MIEQEVMALKLLQMRFSSEIRKIFFSEGVVMHCHRLPREVVESPHLLVFRNWVDITLRVMVCWAWL